MSDATIHIPVLAQEISELGRPQSGQTWVDGTAGGGGHCQLILQALAPEGRLLAVDRDPAAAERLESVLGSGATVRHASYDEIPDLLADSAWPKADGILLDLGLSSDQLADRDRGFSFQMDGPLDMRFDPSGGQSAWEWLAQVDERTLADTIYRYGEERFSRRIARRVVESRKTEPIRTADQLRELIYRSVPGPRRGRSRHGRVDPATRTFQALRIAVNDELAILERALESLPDCLASGGALLVISFHSLEDRIVKYAFRGDERLEVVTRKPVQATAEEVTRNPRSRSAKLRVARRLAADGDQSAST